MFGLDLDAQRDASHELTRSVRRRAAEVADSIAPGVVVLLTGPSGSGKSTLLRAVIDLLAARGGRVIDAARLPLDDSTCVIDAMGDGASDAPVQDACAVLARAGLAEARLLVSPVAALSDGQRARLRVAMAIDLARCADESRRRRGDSTTAIAIDEFLAPLDRITACCVARGVSRVIRASCRSLIVATAHDDLTDAIKPDVRVRLSLDGTMDVTR